MSDRLDALLPALGERQALGRKAQRGAGIDVECHIAHQFDGSGDVRACGDVDRAASRRLGRLDGLADGICGAGGAVIARAVLPSAFAGIAPAARDFQAATHIRDLRFEDVAEPQLEFAEEPAA